MTTPIKALIVEADNSSAHQIKKIIEENGFETASVATNGMAALQAVTSSHFDLAIIDFGLPNSWSDTVLHALSKKEVPASLVLLYLPEADDLQQLKEKFPEAAFLPKPYSATSLISAASKALQGYSTVIS